MSGDVFIDKIEYNLTSVTAVKNFVYDITNDISTNHFNDVSNLNFMITDLSDNTNSFRVLFNGKLTGLATYIYGDLTNSIDGNTNNINGYKQSNDASINIIKTNINDISTNFYPIKSLIDNRIYEISGVYVNSSILTINVLERDGTNPKGI